MIRDLGNCKVVVLKDGIIVKKNKYSLRLDRHAKYEIAFPNGGCIRGCNYSEMVQHIFAHRLFY